MKVLSHIFRDVWMRKIVGEVHIPCVVQEINGTNNGYKRVERRYLITCGIAYHNQLCSGLVYQDPREFESEERGEFSAWWF